MSSVSISRGRMPVSPLRGSRALATRMKIAAVVASMGGFGALWGLVSLNVVGATNQPQSQNAVTPQVNTPSTNSFFGQGQQQQPQPNLFAGGGFGAGSGNGPVFQSRTS